MSKKFRWICLFVVSLLFVGLFPIVTTNADTKYDDYAGSYYLAKGETVFFQNKLYPGKMSVVDDAGNKVKISGKKIKVKGKKTGDVVIKIGKKKIGIYIIIGGNNKDPKVNYKEYNLSFTDGKKEYKNYIDCIRYRVKKNKELPYVNFKDENDNDLIKSANRGVYLGEYIFDVNDIYPSWSDYGGWTEENGDRYLSTQCALYYDKTSDCVFYKLFYGLVDTDHPVVSGVEWGCWKNKSRVFELEILY